MDIFHENQLEIWIEIKYGPTNRLTAGQPVENGLRTQQGED